MLYQNEPLLKLYQNTANIPKIKKQFLFYSRAVCGQFHFVLLTNQRLSALIYNEPDKKQSRELMKKALLHYPWRHRLS